MPLGTLDRTPPPFFRQGPSSLTKLAVFSALAIFLMAADSRLKYTQPIRAAFATVLLPVQRTLLVPVELIEGGGEYMRGLAHAIAGERDAKAKLVSQAERAARVEQLSAENARLRALLDLRPALTVKSHSAEVLYEATDPYSRKVFIDRGSTQGVLLGSPVINDAGVLGQVTRVYPLSSEITLLADREAAIPVLNPRTQQRSAAFGAGDADLMELRFVSANADVQPGDLLITSGVDGVYPPGLAVATVVKVDRKVDSGFARIVLQAKARPDGVRHVLVLDPLSAQMPPRPEPDVEAAAKPARRG
ncbi:MAG TPA: rod shape-determining protein MreC, partial [Burkholderiaceae bacterium]|nr:rod shape-determining protein MreC [Burkholderiaceae bacterium]